MTRMPVGSVTYAIVQPCSFLRDHIISVYVDFEG